MNAPPFLVSPRITFLFALSFLALVRLVAAPVSSSTLQRLTFDQKLGAPLPSQLTFTDEDGATVHLKDYFGPGPIILALGYYQCPMLCNLVLNGIVESVQEIKPAASQTVQLIFVSIDPSETAELARAKKRIYLKRFGRADAAKQWHFLTGNPTNIQQLASAVGFHYAYDSERREYAHPSGIIVLTPAGKISRYFFGVSYPARDLQLALREAHGNRTGARAQPLLMLCSRFMALTGKYSGVIMLGVRVVGIATIVGVGGVILAMNRRRVSRPPTGGGSD